MRSFKRLLAMVAHTDEVEYSCEQAHRVLDEYADCVMRGEDVTAMLPLVHKHLEMCPDCREEYEALMRIVRSGPLHPAR
ncbi:MAG: hypothetical protein HYR71_13610 [Chloroflexi bacterium]|nr:hypothetical protein [Chloroflexota bacterium]